MLLTLEERIFNLRTSLNSKAKPEKKYCKKMDGIGARKGRIQTLISRFAGDITWERDGKETLASEKEESESSGQEADN